MLGFKYSFKPKSLPTLSGFQIVELHDTILRGEENVITSLDLGLSFQIAHVDLEEGVLEADRLRLSLKIIRELSKLPGDNVYVIDRGSPLKIARYSSGRYYKLKVPKLNWPPTIEISGIHMHAISEVDPWNDARLKVEAVRVKPGVRVLDTCTGLGYTASWSLLKGCEEVVSVEKDPVVLEFATYNPWSRFLSSKKIHLILGDVVEVVEDLGSREFDVIVHDPPRISIAGELYSKEFYKKLHRLLRDGGRLYHYTGKPLKIRGVNISKGVAKRLEDVGFRVKKSYCGVVGQKR